MAGRVILPQAFSQIQWRVFLYPMKSLKWFHHVDLGKSPPWASVSSSIKSEIISKALLAEKILWLHLGWFNTVPAGEWRQDCDSFYNSPGFCYGKWVEAFSGPRGGEGHTFSVPLSSLVSRYQLVWVSFYLLACNYLCLVGDSYFHPRAALREPANQNSWVERKLDILAFLFVFWLLHLDFVHSEN